MPVQSSRSPANAGPGLAQHAKSNNDASSRKQEDVIVISPFASEEY
jgi:hypothetical protein